MGRQKSGISMLSLQRLLEIKSYKTIWTMGHKIRKAIADRDASYPGLFIKKAVKSKGHLLTYCSRQTISI
jgi:hypothetical protein